MKMFVKKELERQKKQQEEMAAAEVFKEFVETFEKPESTSKTFVLGSVFNSGHEEEKGSTKVYKPCKLQELEDRKRSDQRNVSSSHGTSQYKATDKLGKKKEKEKKKTNLELFKEELKQIQEEREERHRLKHMMRKEGRDIESTSQSSSHKEEYKTPNFTLYDTGDPNSTNIYLGNINPKMSEQQLMEAFGTHGPLASVKIMWPRSEEERARNRNCGFVAFMCRKDAERAMKSLNGKIVQDYEMKLGWGKAVPIPGHPIYIPSRLLELTMPPPPSGLPFNAQPDPADLDKLPPKDIPYHKLTPRQKENLEKVLANATVKVVIPTDRHLLCLIHRMIEFVIKEGPMFEAMIMNREINNPMFRFLFDNQSPPHIYYRWRLFSVLQGEHPSKWRPEEFRLFKNGSLWKPPPVNLYLQGMPEHLIEKLPATVKEESPTNYKWSKVNNEARESSRCVKEDKEMKKTCLTDKQREKFEDILRNITPERSKVSDAMIFCIDHAIAAEEIVDCISESLSLTQTPLYKKTARLYLISDILHNCCVKVANAHYYRKAFQSKLPNIFAHIRDTFSAIEGRLKAEQFKQRVMNCFKAWEDWAVFPGDYLIRLQNIFLGLIPKPQALEQRLDGMDDIDGVPVDDSDIDGIPIDGSDELFQFDINNSNSVAKFKPSKWETVDPDLVESQAMTTSKWDTLEKEDEEDIDGKPMDSSSSQLSSGDARSMSFIEQLKHELASSDERRAKLRDIEKKVLKYQEELESSSRSKRRKVDIKSEVEEYRRKLLHKIEPLSNK